MSAAAGVCPHCAARQSSLGPSSDDLDASPAPPPATTFTDDEKRALLAVERINAPMIGAGPGLFQVLLLPHPQTGGPMRVFDVLLTVAAVPLILSGAVALLFFGRRRAFGAMTQRLGGDAELTAAVFASVVGTAGVFVTSLFVPHGISPLFIAGLGVVALFLRLALRRAAESSRR